MAMTGNNDAFKYDIAFSFVGEDEGLATQLNDRVQDRFRTFLYSKAQEQLAGTDGEKTFNAVFGEQARTVAVLLRPEWGQTPWTRIEETAIRNRAHEQGYDFTTFIVTTPGTAIPKWLPKARIWYNLERFGLDGAAAVLVGRIQEHGGDTTEETLAARTARFERARQFKQEQMAFKNSEAGVNASRQAYQRLIDDLTKHSELLSSRMHHDNYSGITLFIGNRVVLAVQYFSLYPNSLKDAVLLVKFFDGIPSLGRGSVRSEPHTLKEWKFKFELVGPGRTSWVGPGGKEHAPEALADFLLRHFLELQQRQLG
jgi:hypothetical protein